MTFANLLLFAGVYALAVVSPGPGIALTVARALGSGLKGVGWFIAGFVLGDVILMSLAVLGLSALAQSFEADFLAVKLAGAGYLLWLAWKIFRSPPKALDLAADPRRDSGTRAFLSSLALTLGNPKAIVFFVALMPLAVDMTRIDVADYSALVAIVVVVMVPILLTASLLAHRARQVFRSERALRRINTTTAVMMASVAVLVATR